MTDSNNMQAERKPTDREFDGLFCEDLLREWLQNLEELVRRRDQARKPVEVRSGRSENKSSRSIADH